jgi:hypothetical protein
MGGCELTRDTEKWLKEAGSWSGFDLTQLAVEQPAHKVIPHIGGVLRK